MSSKMAFILLVISWAFISVSRKCTSRSVKWLSSSTKERKKEKNRIKWNLLLLNWCLHQWHLSGTLPCNSVAFACALCNSRLAFSDSIWALVNADVEFDAFESKSAAVDLYICITSSVFFLTSSTLLATAFNSCSTFIASAVFFRKSFCNVLNWPSRLANCSIVSLILCCALALLSEICEQIMKGL